MKKFLVVTIAVLLMAAAVIYLLREPLKEMVFARLTADMFVDTDQDSFDPGPATGSHFPGFRATYQGREVSLIDKFDITIPILCDVNALSFKTLGILNEQYQPGDVQYGIPHPGMIIINPRGIVVGKLFLEAYSSRVDSAAALAFAMTALGIDEEP